ncbi:MAG: hypothetical protein NTY67_04270 [Cyanobacteria bacterium]|nr:hypothetical protein [Cyanobacteriota bacterium]
MKLQAREISIDASLTSAKVERHSCHAGRYHLITDLARKGPKQISLFLDRINAVLAASNASSQHSTHTAQSAQARAERVELSLITVLAIDDADLRSPPFPLFDFLGIKANTDDGGSEEAYGVMLSTYIHDLDRTAIEHLHERSDNFNDSRQLVDSLFFPSKFNGDEPPFFERFPVFAFPSRPTAPLPAPTSPTDRYMHCLGFDCTIVHRPQGKALRSYTHHCDSKTRDSLAMNSAILAVGQVCAEMVEPSLYRQLDCSPTTLERRPQPFDRSMFNATLKHQQKQAMQQWLAKHEHLLDRSQRTSSQVNQAGSPVISSN